MSAAEKAREQALKLADAADIQAEAAQRRLDRAKQEHDTFEATHADELKEELRPASEEATAEWDEGIAQAVQAHSKWHAVMQRRAQLDQKKGVVRDAPSEHQHEAIARELKQVAGDPLRSPLGPRQAVS